MWEGTITGSFTFPGPHPYFFPLTLRKLSLRGKDLDSPSLSVCLHLPIPVDLDASLPPLSPLHPSSHLSYNCLNYPPGCPSADPEMPQLSSTND